MIYVIEIYHSATSLNIGARSAIKTMNSIIADPSLKKNGRYIEEIPSTSIVEEMCNSLAKKIQWEIDQEFIATVTKK